MQTFYYFCPIHKNLKINHLPNVKITICPKCKEQKSNDPKKLKRINASKFNQDTNQERRQFRRQHKQNSKQHSKQNDGEVKIKKLPKEKVRAPTTLEDLSIYISLLEKYLINPIGVKNKNLPEFINHINKAIEACKEGIFFCKAYGKRYEGFEEFVINCSEQTMYQHYKNAKQFLK